MFKMTLAHNTWAVLRPMIIQRKIDIKNCQIQPKPSNMQHGMRENSDSGHIMSNYIMQMK